MLTYHAAFYKFEEDDGWYVVSVLDFPGVNTQGKTLREARLMVKDALKLMAESYLEEGRPLPRPNPKAFDSEARRIEQIPLGIQVHAPVPA
ncbi:MAG: type II toxin-antitoxin system HicB family antitoxin [Planctomycetes bacterium]|jgi:predicted RNase H-like HicB family nuclease|nr:type II toxin-antitoxin system HicB family antitoxin [Planctomycetota bacterium]